MDNGNVPKQVVHSEVNSIKRKLRIPIRNWN